MESVENSSIVQRVVRIDKGTENVKLHDAQLMLREDQAEHLANNLICMII